MNRKNPLTKKESQGLLKTAYKYVRRVRGERGPEAVYMRGVADGYANAVFLCGSRKMSKHVSRYGKHASRLRRNPWEKKHPTKNICYTVRQADDSYWEVQKHSPLTSPEGETIMHGFATDQGAKNWITESLKSKGPYEPGISPRHPGPTTRFGKRKNPSPGKLVGRNCLLIRTTSGDVKPRGNCPIYGRKDGSLMVRGFFKNAPQGSVTRIDYLDESKAKREGFKRTAIPWKHDFTKERPRITKVPGGFLIKGRKPLWGIR